MPARTAVRVASAVQLAAGVAGLAVAVRRRRAFDLPFLHGDPAHVGRDAWWGGTALSAPVPMLATQAWATGRLVRGADDRARSLLRALATVMVPGYLAERLCRHRLTAAGWDPVETPVVAVGLAAAAVMAALARPGRWDRDGQDGAEP